MADDALYCRLNARGRKQFKRIRKSEFAENYPNYAGIELMAHKAALEGDVECLRDIFSANLDEGVPSRDTNGATPLHLAVRNDRVEAVRWLVRFTDLSPLTMAKHGETPAHVAAAQGHTSCLKVLLGAESKFDVKGRLATGTDNSGFTALHLAIVKYRNDCAKMLISELGTKSVCAVNDSGITAAHVASSAGNIEVLKILTQKHKKVLFMEASDGTTPLYFACQEGRVEALKFLHMKGKCDITMPSNDGLKPIHAACQCGHTNIVKYIVSRLGNSAIFDLTPDEATPLHFAASTGQVHTARWLINSDVGGTLVMAKDKNGDTPAHDAADNGQTEALKLLLENGADLYAINNDGNTPYSLALSGQHPEAANFVMMYASKSPQKPDEGPSQMTIFDLEGEIDVVDFGASATGSRKSNGDYQPVGHEMGEKSEPQPPLGKKAGALAPKKSGKDKNKGKKEKEKRSFIGSSNPTFQSFGKESHPIAGTGETDDDVLEWTQEELAIFKTQQTDKPGTEVRPSSDGSDIVVRYSGSDNSKHSPKKPKPQQPGSQSVTTDYATINEIAMDEERKEKKRGRKISKSIQSALKPGKRVKDSASSKSPQTGFSGPEMGFKPQFRTNPLQQMPAFETHPPPTPPPTPATGGSSAPSDEVQQRVVDTHEQEEEEDDDNPYDEYSRSDPEVVKQKSSKRDAEQHESENKKLLADALDDLSSEEPPPPIPEQPQTREKEAKPEPEAREEEEEEDEEEREFLPKVKTMWPPPAPEQTEEDKPTKPTTRPTGASVLRKWPPANAKQETPKRDVKPTTTAATTTATTTTATRLPGPRLSKKWPPEPTREEVPITEKIKALKPKSPPPQEEKPVKQISPSPPAEVKRAVPLRSVKATSSSQQQESQKTTEISAIKLKKADGKKGSNFSSPDTEVMSGAGDELKKRLLKRQKQE